MDKYRDYLESSQRVRASIESERDLSQIIDNAMLSWDLGRNVHSFFLVGNFGSHHTAVRTLKPGKYLEYMQADLEYCARKYAESIASRYRVPNFAIGAIIRGIPCLFTEDLTEGGKYRIKSTTNDHGGILEHLGQEVLFDFGLEHLTDNSKEEVQAEMLSLPLFFAPEHLLSIR